nr:uncharacterized protein LOC122270620 [Parasteatoda tepidariorum]
MQKFDPEKLDMALFLTLFQRQAKKAQIDEGDWVTQLLALLPVEIAEIIIREPEERADDFEYVKKLLLDRFKLSPEAFRTKFIQHQRRPGALWKDLIFELRSYLEGWLEGVQITDFEALKKLMLTDQIKRRVPGEIKEGLIDSWVKFIDPESLANKLDEYEAVRKPLRKNITHKSPI